MQDGHRIAIGPAFGDFGGVSQHVRNLARASRHAPLLFRIPPWSIFHPAWSRVLGGVEARGVRAPDPWVLGLARSLRAMDLVHVHAYPFWIDAYLRPRNPDGRFVVTVHQVFREEDVPPREWPRWRALNERLVEACRKADAVVSVARWQAEALAERGVDAEVVPNGVDLGGLADADAERFRARHGLRGPFFLTAAALIPYKRPEHLAALATRMPERAFVLVGRGATAEGLARYLGRSPPSNVHALGEVPRQDLVDAFAACRAFLLPSRNDTFPTALLEAMGSGKPVVASRSAGPAEIVEDGRSGFLFEPDDVDDLEKAAARAWDAPAAVGVAARERAAAFDWPRVAARIDDLYDRVLEDAA